MARFFLFLFSFLSLTATAQNRFPNVQYNEELHQLFIVAEKKPIVKIEAQVFSFRPELIAAQEASVAIFFDSDSIYHPCANFTYNPITTELWISRTSNGLGRAPFFDSYHQLEIKAEAAYWKTNTATLEFRKEMFQNSDKSAFFQSQDFFDSEIMKQNKGFNRTNPMLELWKLFKNQNFTPIPLRTVVNAFRNIQSDVVALLIDYAVQGFIDFDTKHEVIYFRSKLANYLNNEAKRRDYDNLIWESKSHYATLNMNNFDLTIFDCEFFAISHTNIVNVYPAGERVTVKKNRDLHFSGRVIGGLFDFVARDCRFNYEKFQLFMPQIDSMIMFSEDKSKPKDIYGEYQLTKVKNVLEEVSGTLFIDDHKNKSGNKKNPDYPIFESREGGKVFFDQQFILNAEYKKEAFYFQIDYFKIKSLCDFNISETKFQGKLVSGGIFPDINEPLKLQPDNSLGFVYETDHAGLPIYGGVARFYNTISLSNKGLCGKGKIKYVTSVLESDHLTFYLNTVKGTMKTFQVNPQLSDIEFPEASTTQADLFFEPYKNEIRVTAVKKPVSIYNDCKFEGTMVLSPKKFFGNGILYFNRAELQSKALTFKHHAIEAENASLRIFEKDNEKKHAFNTDNFDAKIDFSTRAGKFTATQNSSEVRFVSNGFKTKAQHFSWNPIDNNLLRFTWDDANKNIPVNATPARELVKLKSSENILSTIAQGRSGMNFNISELDFDFERKELVARGVHYIPVGDAAIIPHNGEIAIHENAAFSRINKARILASIDKMYHELYNCSVEIVNGDNFRGSGYYDYIDALNTTQTFHFDTLWFFRATRGTATIKPEANFTLSPHFGFSGNVELNSTQEFLTFQGGVSMLHNSNVEKQEPLRINQTINPQNIFIEINNKSRDINDRKATVAIASSNASGRIYTCFGGAKEQVNDSEYITALGAITYNNEIEAYQAASLEKLNNPQLPGNIITLYNKDSLSVGEGTIDMGAKLGRVDFNTFGKIVNYMNLDSAEMYLTTSINFFFNEEAMKIMNQHFANANDFKVINIQYDNHFSQSLINLLGKEEYEKFENVSNASIQSAKLPKQLDVKFLFSTLNFMWSPENAAFESQRELPLVISNGKNIYKVIPGKIVIEKKGSKNTLYIYFELGKTFFFFQFENNSLYAFSSDERFNNAITKTKAFDKTLSSKEGQAAFSYKIGNRGQKTKFIKKYFFPL